MTLVVDASVAVKWVVAEDDSKDANALRTESGLIAPSLVAAEIGNALWKQVLRKRVSPHDAMVALDRAVAAFESLVALEEIHLLAFELATELRHPIYDCFYLALAQREGASLVTADNKMLGAAKKAKIKVLTL